MWASRVGTSRTPPLAALGSRCVPPLSPVNQKRCLTNAWPYAVMFNSTGSGLTINASSTPAAWDEAKFMQRGHPRKHSLLPSDDGCKKYMWRFTRITRVREQLWEIYVKDNNLRSITGDGDYMVYSLYSVSAPCLPPFRLWTCSRRGYMHYISFCQSKRTHAILIFFICTFYLAGEGKPSDTIRKTTGFGPRLSHRAKGVSDLWCANFQELLRENVHARCLWFRHQAAKKDRQPSLSQNKPFCLIAYILHWEMCPCLEDLSMHW